MNDTKPKGDALKSAQADAKAFARSITKTLEEAADAVLDLKCRSLTAKQVAVATWKIWGHFRDNPKTLDSERQCKLIHETILSAVQSVQSRLEEATREIEGLKSQRREMKAHIQTLEKAIPAKNTSDGKGARTVGD